MSIRPKPSSGWTARGRAGVLGCARRGGALKDAVAPPRDPNMPIDSEGSVQLRTTHSKGARSRWRSGGRGRSMVSLAHRWHVGTERPQASGCDPPSRGIGPVLLIYDDPVDLEIDDRRVIVDRSQEYSRDGCTAPGGTDWSRSAASPACEYRLRSGTRKPARPGARGVAYALTEPAHSPCHRGRTGNPASGRPG